MERVALSRLVEATGCAETHHGFTFLCDPGWTEKQRAAFTGLVAAAAGENAGELSEQGWLCLPTGGTSGGLKFSRHDEHTVSAAIVGFCAHFRVARVNAINVLPRHHVSGLMGTARCVATSGQSWNWSWKKIEAGERPVLPAGDWFISLVPTQLQRLLGSEEATAWLRGFRAVLIGGGPMWSALTEAAAEARLPLAPSYGMTETAAMVAALTPDEFLSGERSSGRAMPHAQITLNAERVVTLAGTSVHRGYFGGTPSDGVLVTEDLGELDARGYLTLLGRRDAVIITGGKKVQPLEVENVLRATGAFADIAVIGAADAKWGQQVVALYPKASAGDGPDWAKVNAAMELELAPYQRPKRWVAIEAWPRNAQGKLNRSELAARL